MQFLTGDRIPADAVPGMERVGVEDRPPDYAQSLRTPETSFFILRAKHVYIIGVMIKMKLIETNAAPAAIGPYSQGYSSNGFLFLSGQIPLDPETGTMPDGIAAQAEQSCKNVGAILRAAGSGFEKVVKTTCYLADIADFAAFNEVYASYFVSKPARSCFAVKDLPKGALCEIEAIAEA